MGSAASRLLIIKRLILSTELFGKYFHGLGEQEKVGFTCFPQGELWFWRHSEAFRHTRWPAGSVSAGSVSPVRRRPLSEHGPDAFVRTIFKPGVVITHSHPVSMETLASISSHPKLHMNAV